MKRRRRKLVVGAARPATAVDDLTAYRDRPEAFFSDVLGIAPWSKQREFIRAVAEHDRIAVKAGQKVSKSNTLAGLALWFVSTRPDARVIYTNSSSRQVREVNFRELRRLYRRARDRIGGVLYNTPDLGLRFPDERQVVGFSTDEPDRFGGISGEHLLFLVDEASGVPPEIFEAIHGNTAGGNAKVVLTGNPLRADGYFFEACTSLSSPYQVLTISSHDSPCVTGEARVPGLATRRWIDEMVAAYGADSVFVTARVKGAFPTSAEGQIIPLPLVDDARKRWEDQHRAFYQLSDRLIVGVDVARMGDDESVLFVRRGCVVLEPRVFRHLDTVALACEVLQVASEYRHEHERPLVRVDSIGIGAGVVDSVRHAGAGPDGRLSGDDVDVVEVNVGESASSAQFERKRDECWFALRDWLRAGGCIPPDDKLHGELIAPRYAFTASQKIKVESKDELKKRLKRSPDRADALALAVLPEPALMGFSAKYDSPMVLCERDEVRSDLERLVEEKHFCYVGGGSDSEAADIEIY